MPVDTQAPVLKNTRLTADYNVLALEAPEIAAAVQPGQFVMVRTSVSDPLLRRPFSVFEILRDTDGRVTGFTILCKRVGPGTARLFDATPGDRFACLGPLGRPFDLVLPPTEAWMVAGGVGLAPFVTLAEQLRASGVPVTLFFGGRRASELFALDVFERLGVAVHLATEDGSRGVKGLVTAPLTSALDQRSSRPVMIYACGPEPMLKAVALLGIQYQCRTQVAMERIMGCGLGGCYSCVVRVRREDGHTDYVRSCLSGPVFRGEDVVWD
jgi:dihydroorotate dehydrogenase electron transfer subunit